jgi:hypothetical protein
MVTARKLAISQKMTLDDLDMIRLDNCGNAADYDLQVLTIDVFDVMQTLYDYLTRRFEVPILYIGTLRCVCDRRGLIVRMRFHLLEIRMKTVPTFKVAARFK